MFCSWGMYAFTEELKDAWRQLHRALLNESPPGKTPDPDLRFDTDRSSLLSSDLWIGQTCGYPLVTSLAKKLNPLCVPVFDADGCEGGRYSSAIVVSAKRHDASLAEFAGTRVAINGADSNSGMNVLRSAIQALDIRAFPFFSETLISGTHRNSVAMVANGNADIAAIDCVTLALLNDSDPALTRRVRVLSYSEATTGLPFVVPADDPADAYTLLMAFNEALETLPRSARTRLRIRELLPVSIADYHRIATMDQQSNALGHRADDL